MECIQITPAGGIFFCGGNLEKQLPKKPIEVSDAHTPKIGEFRVAKCPNCGKEVSDRFDVCLECGQKNDW